MHKQSQNWPGVQYPFKQISNDMNYVGLHGTLLYIFKTTTTTTTTTKHQQQNSKQKQKQNKTANDWHQFGRGLYLNIFVTKR